jgi:hypothetical protein
MALPSFREDGWLPEGHHAATWPEVALRFGGVPGSRRAATLSSLLRWRDAARAKRMSGLVILDGSFISSKDAPGDFDLFFLYDAPTETLARNDPEARALTDYQACRALGFLGDVFALPASLQKFSPLLGGLDMFDFDRRGTPKGVVEVML